MLIFATGAFLKKKKNSGDTQTRKDSHSFLTEDTLRKYFSTILSPHNEPRRNRLDSWGVGSAAHTRLIHQQNPHNSAFFSPPLLCFCFLFCFFFNALAEVGESCGRMLVPASAWRKRRCGWCAGWGISRRISLGKCWQWRKSRPASSRTHFPGSLTP